MRRPSRRTAIKVLAILIAALTAGTGGLVSAPALAASGQPISGMFTVHFPKAGEMLNVFPCPQGVFCGVGELRGFGAAEFDSYDGNFQPVAGTNCLSFSKEDDISLIGTTSTLVLVGSGQLCFPGSSGNGPPNGTNQDYGHPSFWTSNLTVSGAASSGVFAQATGAVTETFTVAGGVGIWQVTGTIAL